MRLQERCDQGCSRLETSLGLADSLPKQFIHMVMVVERRPQFLPMWDGGRIPSQGATEERVR